MRARSIAVRTAPFAAALLIGCVAALPACAPKGTLAPNVPPETGIFVQGPVDTVNHLVRLYWYGTDVDGFVVAYELRFLDPLAPADTQWVRTTRTDSLIAVFVPTGLSEPLFQVRAIDDDGAVDPEPAAQAFTFSNQAPTVNFQNEPGLTDSTFASVTLRWFAADPDGDGTKLLYRVWLDGNEANADLTQDKFITLATDRFRQGGQLLAGYRTVYLQGIDDGGRAGNIDSTRWFVRAPTSGTRARLLVIDDVPSSNPANFTTDTVWTNTASRNLPADQWSLLRLEFTQPFRSAEDVRQTMSLFEHVIWYRGNQTNFSTVLRDYQDGIAAYIDAGGGFFVEGLNLIQGFASSGPLREDWVTDYLGSTKLLKYETSLPGDSSTTWGIATGRVLVSTTLADSLRAAGIFGGLRGFDVIDTNHVLLWAPPNQLTQLNQTNVPVALSVPQAGGGRMTIVTGPLRGLDGYRTVPRFLAKTFQRLGLTGP